MSAANLNSGGGPPLGERSVGAAVSNAVSFLSADIFSLFIVAVVPELVIGAFGELAEASFIHRAALASDVASLLSLALHEAWLLVAWLALYLMVRIFAWGSVCEVLRQRQAKQTKSAAKAMAKAARRFGYYSANYGAFLIPAMMADGLSFACAGALGLFSYWNHSGAQIAFVVGMGFLAIIPLFVFRLWATGFELLIAPAAILGEEGGLVAYRHMRQHVRGEWPQIVVLALVVWVATIAGWLLTTVLGLALPSHASSIDWQQLVSGGADPKSLLRQFAAAPKTYDMARTALEATADALVFAVGAVLGWCWYDSAVPKESKHPIPAPL